MSSNEAEYEVDGQTYRVLLPSPHVGHPARANPNRACEVYGPGGKLGNIDKQFRGDWYVQATNEFCPTVKDAIRALVKRRGGQR